MKFYFDPLKKMSFFGIYSLEMNVEYITLSQRQSTPARSDNFRPLPKFRSISYARKLMPNLFWDYKRLILEYYMLRGFTINCKAYCDLLENH